jgi:hypothetical protein
MSCKARRRTASPAGRALVNGAPAVAAGGGAGVRAVRIADCNCFISGYKDFTAVCKIFLVYQEFSLVYQEIPLVYREVFLTYQEVLSVYQEIYITGYGVFRDG